MGTRDRPHREVKKKPKDKAGRSPSSSRSSSRRQNVEVIKPKRKPRTEETDES